MRKLEQIKQQREPGKTETKIQTWTPKKDSKKRSNNKNKKYIYKNGNG